MYSHLKQSTFTKLFALAPNRRLATNKIRPQTDIAENEQLLVGIVQDTKLYNHTTVCFYIAVWNSNELLICQQHVV